MTTKAPPALVTLQNRIEAAVPSAVNAGIVGDAAHRLRATKHISLEDNPPGSWPTVGPHDAAPPGRWSRQFAAAFDSSMSRSDQNRVHNNLKKIFFDRTDPRRRYIAAFNGWDGQGNPGRYNLVTNTISITDDSHKTHEHGETFYEFANDPAMVEAWMSAIIGESKAAYLTRLRGNTSEEDELNSAQNNALSNDWSVGEALRSGGNAPASSTRPAGPVWTVVQLRSIATEQTAARLRDEAILTAVRGDDDSAIIDAVNLQAQAIQTSVERLRADLAESVEGLAPQLVQTVREMLAEGADDDALTAAVEHALTNVAARVAAGAPQS